MEKTEIIKYNNTPSNIRVDKNFAFHIQSFRQFGKDAMLLKAIVYYMAINYQKHDLFGFYKIDPAVFAKTMALNRAHLFVMHESPYFLEHDYNAEELVKQEAKHGRNTMYRTWSTVFENALYVLTNKSFIEDYRTVDSNKTVITTQRFNFIDEIRFELIRVAKTRKVMYYYKPNEAYEKNLKSYFINTLASKFTELRKPKLDDAYLTLLNWINNQNFRNQNSIWFSIDYLATILNIAKYERFSPYKIKVTQKFNTLKKAIGNDVPNLELTWVKPTQDVTELIGSIVNQDKKVVYNNVALITWSRFSKTDIDQKKNIDFTNIFDTDLNRNLVSTYFNTHEGKLLAIEDDRKIVAFYVWIFSQIDMEAKEITFDTTYLEVKKTTYNISEHRKLFLKCLKYLCKIQKEHNCFSFENGKVDLHLKGKDIVFDHFYEVLNYFYKQVFADK